MSEPDRPTRAANVTLAGQLQDSSYTTPQWLIQRGERYLQVSEILYRIAELADGTHTPEELAILVAAMTRRDISADDVRMLITQKLAPAGIVAISAAAAMASGAGATTPAAPDSAASPLRIHLRAAVIGARAIAPFAWLGSALYLPGIVIVAIIATLASRIWLYRDHGVTQGLEGVIAEPWHLAALALIAVGSAVFHELGHASALRAAGGRARGMGIGLYLIYPVFYTDVTDSYRLGRWRRILVDLGGFYFNLIFALGVLAAYALTRQEWLLVAVTIVDLEVLHQTIPLGRLDGYWLLTDLTGVPDLFAIAGPFARRVAGQKNALPPLRPLANVVVALYLVLILPALALFAYAVAQNLPRLSRAIAASFLARADALDSAFASRDLGAAASTVGQGVLLVLPLLAVLFFLFGIARLFARLFVRVAGSTPRQRIASVASAVIAIALLLALWAPFGFGEALFSAARDTNIPRAFDGRLDPIELPSAFPTDLPKLTLPHIALPSVAPRTTLPLPVVPAPARTAAPATDTPTSAPATDTPTTAPATAAPTAAPTTVPTSTPTTAPTAAPSASPSTAPIGGTP
jgi:putative peptide zinc metalloprotease protein